MSTAVLSLGSNVGDRHAHLSAAVEALGDAVCAVSAVYRTPPWGPVAQDEFYNLVATVADPGLDARGWLDRCRALEAAAARTRDVRWGPRTLDVDVISVVQDGDPVRSDDPELTLPHPRAHERAFVLLPWAEIDPDAELPGRGAVAELLGGLDTAGIHRVGRVR